MQRAAPGLRAALTSRIAELERTNPEWQPWLAMLREAARAHRSVDWAARVFLAEPASRKESGPDAPLLHGRTILVDGPTLERVARGLAKAGGSRVGLDDFRPGVEDIAGLIEATIRGAAEPGAVRSLGELLASMVLRVCGETLAAQVPPQWPHGYCPACGVWPVLAELRGMDRARRLRCGRCSTDWQMAWLRCAYCGEAEHERLTRLVPEGALESRFVEACGTCRRYLKCISTLTSLPPLELLLRDLETVELDVAALDRGYQRPAGPGFPVTVQVRAQG